MYYIYISNKCIFFCFISRYRIQKAKSYTNLHSHDSDSEAYTSTEALLVSIILMEMNIKEELRLYYTNIYNRQKKVGINLDEDVY